MVLHIAVDGIDGVGKTTIVDKLCNFFTKKAYNCTSRKQPSNPEIISILNQYNLTNHEIALLMAFDRSFTYYGENWEKYDLVFWDRSILSSYAYNMDNHTPRNFIRQINKYFPLLDLYIIIESDKILNEQDYTTNKEIIKNYQWLSKKHKNTQTIKYKENQPDKVFDEVVQCIFNNLPKCNWCGRLFTPTQKLKKYCRSECSKYSLEDQYRVNNRNYYMRYKDTWGDRRKRALGSKNANLHGTADPNPFAELEKVRRAKKSLGLKPIQ
ncbi:hypothetical protein [Methanobrevibacter sp.]